MTFKKYHDRFFVYQMMYLKYMHYHSTSNHLGVQSFLNFAVTLYNKCYHNHRKQQYVFLYRTKQRLNSITTILTSESVSSGLKFLEPSKELLAVDWSIVYKRSGTIENQYLFNNKYLNKRWISKIVAKSRSSTNYTIVIHFDTLNLDLIEIFTKTILRMSP